MPDAGRRTLQIIKNVLMNWLGLAVTILVGFFMSPFLVHHLGNEIYGVWILLGSLIGYFELLDLGLQPATVKRVAEFRARGDQAAINRLVTGGFAIFVLLGSVALVATGVLAGCFNSLFHTPLAQSTAAVLVLVVGVNFALNFPALIFIGVLRGYQRYDLDAAVTSLIILVRSAVIVVLILKGYGILGLAFITFAFDTCRLVWIIFWVYRINPAIRIRRAYFDWAEMRELLRHSTDFALIGLGNRLNFVTDAIVIGLFLPTAQVTFYFIANRLMTYLRDLVLEMTGVLMPAVSDRQASEDAAGVRELHIGSTKYTVLIALPIAAVFYIMGDSFIRLWMGPGYSTSALILKILTVAIVLHLLGLPTVSVLNGLGQHRAVARYTVMQALCNLALTLLLVRPFGLVGVALATLISMLGFLVVALPIFLRRYLHLPLGDYLRQSMLLPLVIQPPYVALLLLVRTYAAPSSLPAFFGLVALSLVPYAALSFVTCLNAQERRGLSRLASKFGLKLAMSDDQSDSTPQQQAQGRSEE